MLSDDEVTGWSFLDPVIAVLRQVMALIRSRPADLSGESLICPPALPSSVPCPAGCPHRSSTATARPRIRRKPMGHPPCPGWACGR